MLLAVGGSGQQPPHILIAHQDISSGREVTRRRCSLGGIDQGFGQIFGDGTGLIPSDRPPAFQGINEIHRL